MTEHLLSRENMNQQLRSLRNAVRGRVTIKATEMNQELADARKESKPSPYSFDQIIMMNIGNPHAVGQKGITYPRQLLALCEYPELLENDAISKAFPEDVVKRAREFLDDVPPGLGAYSNSQGLVNVRRKIAKFLETRDSVPANPSNIFLTNGASQGIQAFLTALVRGKQDGVLVPRPVYTIYTGILTLLDATIIPYSLDEDKEWSLDVNDMAAAVKGARDNGVTVRAVVIINPGNPTGMCLSEDNLTDVAKLCAKEKLILLADEVYQQNVYRDGDKFVSLKKIVCENEETKDVELISFHSISKGVLGECGHRGGFFELHNFDSNINAELYKYLSTQLCANIPGQLIVDVMVDPPREGEPSYELWAKETDGVFQSLKRKSVRLCEALDGLEGVHCQTSSGAMYAFPRLELPPKAIEEAKKQKMVPDVLYALSLLDHGICMVPGSGFGQAEGTHHLRTTFLPREDLLEVAIERFRTHHTAFMEKYA